MTQRVSSGIRALDRQLGGGVPPGKVVTLLAEPTSQAELFIAGFISQRETVYLSTERAPTTVTAALRQQKGPREAHTDLTVTRLDRDAPVIDAINHVEALPDESVLVIDPIESLECADAGQYRSFIGELRATLAQTDSIAVLHALKHDSTPAQRHRTEYMSDLGLTSWSTPVTIRWKVTCSFRSSVGATRSRTPFGSNSPTQSLWIRAGISRERRGFRLESSVIQRLHEFEQRDPRDTDDTPVDTYRASGME